LNYKKLKIESGKLKIIEEIPKLEKIGKLDKAKIENYPIA